MTVLSAASPSASICVDYLSYDWQAEELVRARHQVQQQIRETNLKLNNSDPEEDKNTPACLQSCSKRKKLQVEQYRLVRYENAVWRQMARICTDKLSRFNAVVDPSTVDW